MLSLAIAGRMALLVTLFLVLVNIFNSVTGNAPKAEGLTAVETWVTIKTHPYILLFFILIHDIDELSFPGGLLHHPRIWGASRICSNFENYPGDCDPSGKSIEIMINVSDNNNDDDFPV